MNQAKIIRHPIIYLLPTAILLAPSQTFAKDTRISFPKELHGLWEISGNGPCKQPLEQDTQTAINIEKHIFYRYEESNKPILVRQISRQPRSWRIDLISDVDGYKSIETAILILDQNDRLTIANDNASYRYERCT